MRNPALDLLRQHSFFGLAGSDGCLCGSCEVHGVEISTACRKSSGFPNYWGLVIRVSSRTLDVPVEALREVAAFVAADLREGWSGPTLVRFCTWKPDDECACIYCGMERDAVRAYLCAACEAKPDVGPRYAFPEIEWDEDGALVTRQQQPHQSTGAKPALASALEGEPLQDSQPCSGDET